MGDNMRIGNKVVALVREFNEEKDLDNVIKLERSCNVINGPNKFTLSTIINLDPLCRVRLYPIHVMLVAELGKDGEIVGIVRGCVKCVNIGFAQHHVLNIGCILGLRVSPSYRRMGIGLKLVQSVEEWLTQNGATYIFLAIEETNKASTNLFTLKSNYLKFTSLLIYVQPLPHSPSLETPTNQEIEIIKLPIEDAISLYRTHQKSKDMYPTDIESILKEKQSLGSWLCYFKAHRNKNWVLFSIWNTCETYNKMQPIKCIPSSSTPLRVFSEAISNVKEKFLECIKEIKWTMWDPVEKPFGFVFLYGVYGEGERKGELMEAVWTFGLKMGENMKECGALITEMGACDPMVDHVPKESISLACIHDLWYLKRVSGVDNEDLDVIGHKIGNVFVDPRDF